MQRNIIWKGIDADTEEACIVTFNKSNITVHSKITGWAEGETVSVNYYINLDKKWNVVEFNVKAQTGMTSRQYAMKYNKSAWLNTTGETSEFSPCRFIDITLTPLTNTLPINNLQLQVSETSEIEVIYIDIIECDMRIDKQWYTRIDERKYKFKNAFGFTADIDVDKQGFVIAYPQLFKML